MTEFEWIKSDNPSAMLDFIKEKASPRQLRLFACACLELRKQQRPEWELTLPNDAMWEYAETGIKKSSGQSTLPAIQWAQSWTEGPDTDWPSSTDKATLLRLLFGNPFRPVETMEIVDPGDGKGPLLNKAGKPVYGLKGWMVDPQVLSLAQSCYDLRDPGYFPLIWDALETAGCDNEEIRHALAWEGRCPHCLADDKARKLCPQPILQMIDVPICNGTGWVRLPGEPMCPRGTWFIDLLLGLT